MKKILLIALCGGAALAALGQGVVTMNTGASGSFVRFSNTVTRTWAGEGVSVGLYWGESPISVTNLVLPLAGVVQSGSGQGFVLTASGGGNRTVGRSGITTWFQLRAWTGGFPSWEAAMASQNPANLVSLLSGPGSTPIVSAVPSAPPPAPVPQIQWAPGSTSTSPLIAELVPVPEPSVIALGVLAFAGSMFLRRRK